MSWGACMPRIRAPSWCMLLAGVLLLLDCQVECQPVDTVVVHDSAELASALRNASVASQTTPTDTTISLALLSSEAAQNADFFVINRQDFMGNTTTNIWPGQKVTIASEPKGPKTLDFAGVSTILNIMGNGTLEIIGINVRGIASRHLLGATVVPNLRAVGFAFWPTITAQPDAKAVWVNMSTFYLSDDCSLWAQNGPQSGIGVFLAAGSTLQNSVTLNMDQGGATVKLPLVDKQDTRQGTMQLTYTDSRAICIQDPSTVTGAPASADPFKSSFSTESAPAPSSAPAGRKSMWWIALVAAVGAAVLAACVGCGVFLLWRRRYGHGRREGAHPATDQASPKLDGPPHGVTVEALGSIDDNMESEGGGTPMLTEQWRKRWMGAKGGEQIEIGPLIGRGGYGKVFKARWKSTMVAVKVVEHSHIPKSNSNSQSPGGGDRTDPAGAEARIAREMLLSTSISHPNVIATYKICTIRVGSVLDSGFPGPNEQSRESSKQRSLDNSKQGRSDRAEAAEKLRSIQSEGGKPRMATLNSPRSKLQDIAEKGQSSSAESMAASQADSSRETGQLLETWIVMEYADRGNLADALRSGRFPCHDFVAVYRCLLDIAAGVDYLHDADMIHGDLKSANVLLKSTGTDARGFTCKAQRLTRIDHPSLADFGLTRVLDVDKKTHVSTQTYGTVAYMPPELLSSSRLTKAADIYSFGMLMWEMVTSTMPWERMTVGQVFFAVVQEDARPAIPEELPEAYQDLMTECWTREAKDRPSIHAVLKRLQVLYKDHRSQGVRKAMSAPAPQ